MNKCQPCNSIDDALSKFVPFYSYNGKWIGKQTMEREYTLSVNTKELCSCGKRPYIVPKEALNE
jgi:hypothetical protein